MINDFFNSNYEKEINKKLLYRNYVVPYQEIENYVNEIISIPLKDFIDYVLTLKCEDKLSSRDVFQFSNFENATTVLCQKVSELNNPGIKFIKAGQILLNDGKERNKGAYCKYGENHLKTAEDIGLMFSIEKTYFLSCIGEVFYKLSKLQSAKLLPRLLTRNKFIQNIFYKSFEKNINLREELSMLSDSTYRRRKSNISYILNLFLHNDEYDFSFIHNNIQL